MSDFNPQASECSANTPLSVESILDAVIEERRRQDKKWGTNRQHHPVQWLAILIEEVGEANRAALEASFTDYNRTGDYSDLRIELIQVVAVAVATMESMLTGISTRTVLRLIEQCRMKQNAVEAPTIEHPMVLLLKVGRCVGKVSHEVDFTFHNGDKYTGWDSFRAELQALAARTVNTIRLLDEWRMHKPDVVSRGKP